MKSLWAAYENGSKIFDMLGSGTMMVECVVNGVRCDAFGLTREEAKSYAANPEEGLPQTYWDNRQMTFEEFRLQSSNQQIKHIDITQAASYAAWYKAAYAFARRLGEWHVGHFLQGVDLNTIGFHLAYYPKLKAAEYARQVCTELGLKPKVNQGKFKGTDWDLQELYSRLPYAE